MSGAPIMLPARHLINIVLGLAIAAVIGLMMKSGGSGRKSICIDPDVNTKTRDSIP